MRAPPALIVLALALVIAGAGYYLWSRTAAPIHEAVNQAQTPGAAEPAVSNPLTGPAPELQPALPNPDTVFHAQPKHLAPGAATQDWPHLLGPTHNFTSAETKLLKKWPMDGPALVWETKRGTGFAAPAIQNGLLIHFHRVGNEEVVDALKAETGERHWRFAYPSQYEDRYGYNNGPRASPILDGDFVYTYGAQGNLHCLKRGTGEVVWAREILKDYRVSQNFFGVGATPLLEGALLIVNVGAPGACVVAFDKRTGKEVWRAASKDQNWGPSYATPVPAVLHGKRRVLVFAGGDSQPPTGGLLCLDPTSGGVDFAFPWRSRTYESVSATSPAAVGDGVFVTASYETGGAFVEVASDFSPRTAWTSARFGAHFSAVLQRDGYLYGFDGRNERGTELVCFEARTGKEMWRGSPSWEEDLGGNRGTLDPGRGALVWADGAALCLGEYGHLLWLDLTPKGCNELARVWLFRSAETWTPPVICNGLLYICQNHEASQPDTGPRLLCYDLRGE
ncbi:MAG: PQQ-like beta-propeller repeat protein [Planctomycetes bacterium]|nr:PQQ-like beta-propeller repeat protein [Planctomycetota bacterium]